MSFRYSAYARKMSICTIFIYLHIKLKSKIIIVLIINLIVALCNEVKKMDNSVGANFLEIVVKR